MATFGVTKPHWLNPYVLLHGHLTIGKYIHYNDVIMGAIVSQITSLTIVNSEVYSSVDQRKHQSSASLAFVRGIHRRPLNSPHKWPVTRKMYPFDDVIMCKIGRCLFVWPWISILCVRTNVKYSFKMHKRISISSKYHITYLQYPYRYTKSYSLLLNGTLWCKPSWLYGINAIYENIVRHAAYTIVS